MYTLSINMWFQKLMKQFFFGIDQVVYNFISTIYDLLISIARTSVLSQADILDMADRIYKLLAIFMIFKVTLSLITYVVNPDDFSDKSKGISKLSLNIIISLGLLILTPYIFNMAYKLQTIILEDNTLATLIFDKPDETREDDAGDFINSAGDEIAFKTMSAFFTPNTSITQLQNCIELTDDKGKVNPACSGLDASYNECAGNACPGVDDVNNTMVNLTKKGTDENPNFELTSLQNYVAGVDNENLGLMFRSEMAVATNPGNSEFIMDYKYILSTVVGVVVLLLLISFCMDVALRSIKLAFLQLIAPIPILSYVDPKSGKDGMFKKWYQLCFKTYLSLFIRLLALYFAIYIISRLDSMVDIVDGSYVSNIYIKIFIIIGVLMFAKQLPKILEGLGIKLDGDGKFFLNPLRKMENEMAGGKYLKKPNDALGKFARGGFGLSTLGRKTIGGIDAARHGKGFKQGWDRTHGDLYNKFHKKLDEWAPDSAEARKNERLGREEIKSMNTKWTKGDEIREKLKSVGKDFGSLDGDDNNRDAYIKAGFKGEFLQSKMNLDKATEQQKILNRIYQARQMGTSLEDAIANERANIDKYGLNVSRFQTDTDLYKEVDATNKKVSGMEKVHESMRKMNQDQAYLEDAIKFVKYNETDPTDPSRVSKGLSKGTSPSSDSSPSPEISFDDTPSTPDTSVMDRVNDVTGVSRESATDNGATTSAIVESVIEEIRKEMEAVKQTHDTTTNRDEMVKSAEKLKELEKELEDIRRRNS